ncbi:hypothetical protein Mal64_29680 [Pseudobythopirellula maris]|uniref:Uncharacterized protein n=1 Tax=Pseudobythopirellula maris TaxID=2527991 RepID=A0A5C5ZJA2_9BACT|nr:hypothetical protein [Pseudobythopirellula maris]TWT87429.1 hypothetical protein Mal64_29680 [Pseudobythopirellula maris]
MKPCDLDTGATRIRHATEELLRVWEEVSESWDDPVSRAFYEQRIETILPDVKTGLDAIARMRMLLQEAQREVER